MVMNLQMFLLYICIVLFVSCDDLLSEDPLSVNATVGSTALLPCKCTTEPDKTRYVRWRIDTETVFEREGGDWYHGEGSDGRVDVPEDELNKGNCSLVLKNVSVYDDDVYTCSLVVKPEQNLIQKVHLSIDDNSDHSSENETEPPAGLSLYWIIIITVLCVGLVAAAVMIFIYHKTRVIYRTEDCTEAQDDQSQVQQEESSV